MWWYIVIWIVAFVAVSLAMRPKPQTQSNPAFEELDVPNAEEGKEIPVLFGTRDITQANVVWYGDLSVEAIKKSGGAKKG